MSTVTQILFGSRSARPHHQHRDVLYGEAAQARRVVALARETLRQEREESDRIRREDRRAFIRARSQARRDGRQLLKLLDHLPRPA